MTSSNLNYVFERLPSGPSGKEPACQYWRHKGPGFDPWVGKIPWRRKWQPTPVFLPGKSPWTEEPGGLQSVKLQRVRHDWAHVCSLKALCMSMVALGDQRLKPMNFGVVGYMFQSTAVPLPEQWGPRRLTLAVRHGPFSWTGGGESKLSAALAYPQKQSPPWRAGPMHSLHPPQQHCSHTSPGVTGDGLADGCLPSRSVPPLLCWTIMVSLGAWMSHCLPVPGCHTTCLSPGHLVPYLSHPLATQASPSPHPVSP